jgi:hypothetical protein
MTDLERTLAAVVARRPPIVLCRPRSKKAAALKGARWAVTTDPLGWPW